MAYGIRPGSCLDGYITLVSDLHRRLSSLSYFTLSSKQSSAFLSFQSFIMYKLASLPLLFAAAAIAAPEPLLARNGGINCAAFNTIVSIMHEQAVATPFCSSYLHIPRPTTTTTVTSSPPAVTTTTTVTSTDTVTTTSVSTYSTVTTVYPVVAVSTTSTCALSATVVQSKNQKRDPATTPCTTTSIPAYSDPPLGTPLVLTKFVQTDVSSACSCLNIPTQTYTSTVSTTAKPSTVSKS